MSSFSRMQSRRFSRVPSGLLVAAFLLFASAIPSLLAKEPPVRGDSAPKVSARPAAGAKDSKGKDDKLGQDWVRVQYDDRGDVAGMQTAIVRYAAQEKGDSGKAPAVYVDLIGAVHIGDIKYYRELNEHFKQYDALLYELVAPEGTVVQPGRGASSTHPIGALQNGIKTFLELDHQLEYIDYTKPNFIHADMTPSQFSKAMQDRKESFLQMYFRLMGQAMAHQEAIENSSGTSDLDLLTALFAKDRARRLKIVLAKQLAEMESLMTTLGGEKGTVIISERNKTALAVLKKQLDAGKKQLGIFYGAGHLNDMDERLRTEFQLQPVAVTWLTAWNLAAKPN